MPNTLWKKSLATAGIALATLTVSATALTGQASAATDSKVTIGTPISLSQSEIMADTPNCVSDTGVKVCFDAYGDKVRVYDSAADGWSAVGLWATDYDRTGFCRNSGGAGTWVECNYDMRETGNIRIQPALCDGDTGKWRVSPIWKWLPIGG
ncbi:hypothetical protein [Kitasatospora sp. NPDC059673]|uniref:hypothetical protein n=1 Tax=Kitasatospora sp. NPDC059673 TaxID=3346901 RepID=UPI0036B92A3D